METNEVIQATQQWAKANGLDSTKTDQVLSDMDMSDFMVFSQALEAKDYDTISQMYHQVSAITNESYKYFNNDMIMESHRDYNQITLIKSMRWNVLYEFYQRVPGATHATDMLTMAQMQTAIYEHIDEAFAPAATSAAKPFGSSNAPAPMTAPGQPVNPNAPIKPQGSLTPQQMQQQADIEKSQELQAPTMAEPAELAHDSAVNQQAPVVNTNPAGITDPQAAKAAADPQAPQGQGELEIPPEEIMRMAKLAGLL